MKKRNGLPPDTNHTAPIQAPFPATQNKVAMMEQVAKQLEDEGFDSILILTHDASGMFHCWRGGYHAALGMAEEFKSRLLKPPGTP